MALDLVGEIGCRESSAAALLVTYRGRDRTYWRLARRVAREIEAGERSGFTVIGTAGVGASPWCGVATTRDMRCSFGVMARTTPESAERMAINRDAVGRRRDTWSHT